MYVTLQDCVNLPALCVKVHKTDSVLSVSSLCELDRASCVQYSEK